MSPEKLACSKRVRALIVTSNKPMRLDALGEAIAVEVSIEQMAADDDHESDNEFLYTEKQISRLCGSGALWLFGHCQDDDIVLSCFRDITSLA